MTTTIVIALLSVWIFRLLFKTNKLSEEFHFIQRTNADLRESNENLNFTKRYDVTKDKRLTDAMNEACQKVYQAFLLRQGINYDAYLKAEELRKKIHPLVVKMKNELKIPSLEGGTYEKVAKLVVKAEGIDEFEFTESMALIDKVNRFWERMRDDLGPHRRVVSYNAEVIATVYVAREDGAETVYAPEEESEKAS